MAVRVVLVDQIDLLDVGLVLHEGGQRFHLHRGVGVHAEVPVAALAVGQVGIDRRVVDEQHFLAWIALVVLVEEVDDRRGRAGAGALEDIADALVDGGLQCVDRFLRRQLVVERDDLELHAGGVALVELLSQKLKALQLVLAGSSGEAGERVDPRHLDGLAGLRVRAATSQRCRGGKGKDQLARWDRCHWVSPAVAVLRPRHVNGSPLHQRRGTTPKAGQ